MAIRGAQRIVKQVLPALRSQDGDGATVFRSIGLPKLSVLDPFLLLDEFHVAPPAGFPDHPHRGFGTVTYMLEGSFFHRDSKGNAGEIRAGGAQIMRAGKGVVHSEMPGPQGGRGLQLWVNLAAKDKMSPPTYQDIARVPQAQHDGVTVNIVAGEAFGVKSAVHLQPEITFLDISIPQGKSFQTTLPENDVAFAYVIQGSGVFGGSKTKASPKNVLVLDKVNAGDDLFQVENTDNDVLRVALISGRPLNEPIARHGPFVMNTREEIMQAFRDYNDGSFL